MQTDTRQTSGRVFQSIAEMGRFLREKRKQAGLRNLEGAAKLFSVGKRFLSEFERGKETAEIGKVLGVLHGLGLDLAVVPRESGSTRVTQQNVHSYVHELGLEFPYDWSNPGMSEDVLIHNVLEKGRFMDVLRLVKYFGIERIESEARDFVDAPNGPRLNQILERIRAGKAKAKK